VLIDPEYLKDRKVYGHVVAAFRYGREDLDVLGLTFRKDLYLASEQIYPVPEASLNKAVTRLQVKLLLLLCITIPVSSSLDMSTLLILSFSILLPFLEHELESFQEYGKGWEKGIHLYVTFCS